MTNDDRDYCLLRGWDKETCDIAQAYDRVALDYDRLYSDSTSRAESEAIMAIVRRAWKRSGAGHMLDLGCGTGLVLDYMNGTHPRYTGIDISPEMIFQAARKHYIREASGEADFKCLDMSDLAPFGCSSFSTVVSLFGSFSHCTRQTIAAAEMYRVLKPGGRIVVMACELGHQHNPEYLGNKYPTVNGMPLYECAAEWLSLIFQTVGFQNVLVRGLNVTGLARAIPTVFGKGLFLLAEAGTLGAWRPDSGRHLIVTAKKGA